jgi:ribosomal protein S18 acetylase RimI-like enzyme
VGAICSRTEDIKGDPKKQRLYIMTLAVLAAYRGRTVGSQLLRSVLEYCEQLSFKEVCLHVQISNSDAIRFYTGKFGFTQGEMVENYYKRISPPHCFLLYKKFDQAAKSSGEGSRSKATAPDETDNSTTQEKKEQDPSFVGRR